MADTGTSSVHHSKISNTNRKRRYSRPQAKIATQGNLPEGQRRAGDSGVPVEKGGSSSGVTHENDAGQLSNRNPVGNRSHSIENADSATNAVPAPGFGRASKEGPRRKVNFGGALTKLDEAEAETSNPSTKPTARRNGKGKQRLPLGEDLTSTLIRELSTPPYLDCPICFSSIRPEQAIWSCSPSIPIVVSNEAQIREYCWTSFHLKCIRSWAEKSVKEVADAWRARGESNRKGDWRCPGCQAKREITPSSYW